MLAVLLSATLTFQLPQATDAFVAQHNEFALRLVRAVAKDPGNTVLSPYSVAVAMSMAREGARGETAAEIDRVLQLPDGGAGNRFAELAKMLATLGGDSASSDSARELSIANAMWGQSGYTFEPSFIARLSTGFGAQFFKADFARDPNGARDAINAWVVAQTQERIQDLLPAGEPNPDSRLVLVNALYLKAHWVNEFQPENTRSEPFNVRGVDVKVPTMVQTSHFLGSTSERADVLTLAYTDGLEMLIVLPKTRDGLANVIELESVADWTTKREMRETELRLPKFTLEKTFDLIPTLQALGIAQAFDAERADFSGISPLALRPDQRLHIGVVRQKAYIAVDESGTEAAAATELGLKAGAAPSRTPPHKFNVDHPFLFVIRHPQTGLVLFVGRVDDPTK